MKMRGQIDHLVIKRGRLCVKTEPNDPAFPRCPICSPASAISRAHELFTDLAHKAAKRDGLSVKQTENLLGHAAGGFDAFLPSDLARKSVRAPTKGRPNQWTTVPVLCRGLNRLFWRIAAGAAFHGVLKQFGACSVTYILAASPSKLPRTGKVAERRKRSVEGDRDARKAIRWLMRGETSPAEFVRALFEPCGIHEAKFDLRWCGWNSERGRLRAGVPVSGNRGPEAPRGEDRPHQGVAPSVIDEIIDREDRGESIT